MKVRKIRPMSKQTNQMINNCVFAVGTKNFIYCIIPGLTLEAKKLIWRPDIMPWHNIATRRFLDFTKIKANSMPVIKLPHRRTITSFISEAINRLKGTRHRQ